MNETLFIINPTSARGKTLSFWGGARRVLQQLGVPFVEQVTTRIGEAITLTRTALQNGVRRIVAVGGDGTLSEVVNGYLTDDGKPIRTDAAIGLLPSGTGSDFRRSVGLQIGLAQVHSFAAPHSRLLDAVRASYINRAGVPTSRFYLNLASFGLGGDAVALVNQWRARLPQWVNGNLCYAAGAIRALGKYKNRRVELQTNEGKRLNVETNFLVVANGRFAGGGMQFAPAAQLDDGLLDVLLTDRLSRFDILKELPRIRWGGHLKNKKVIALQAREISIDATEPMAIDLDGEMVGHTPARLTALPGAVRFLVG